MRNGNRPPQVSQPSHGTGAFTTTDMPTGNSAVAGSTWPTNIPMSTISPEEDGLNYQSHMTSAQIFSQPHDQWSESGSDYDDMEYDAHHQHGGHGGQEMGEGEEDDDDDNDNDDQVQNESLFYGHHYLSTNQMLGHHPQPSYYTGPGLDGYISDDVDMSDDAGAPLVDYLQVANLLTNDMDTDVSDSGGEHAFPYELSMEPENEDSVSMTSALSDEEQFSQYPPAPPAPFTPFTLGLVNQMLAATGPGWSPATTASPADVINGLINAVHPQVQVPPTTFLDTFPHPTHGPNFHSMTSLGPSNDSLTEFLYRWARPEPRGQGVHLPRGPYPWANRIADLVAQKLPQTRYADLAGDQCDFQSVNWEKLGVTRQEARQRRLLMYRNYVNVPGSDKWDVSRTSLECCPCQHIYTH